jgi:hypothetical protein
MSWEKSSVISIDSFIEKFDLRRDAIYEVIVSTINKEDNQVHAAPMGIIFKQDYILIKPYKTSRTFKFMEENKFACINFVDDLELFYNLSREDKNIKQYVDQFEIIPEFTAYIYKDSNLSIEVKVIEDLNKNGVRAEFKCEPLNYIHKIEYRKKLTPINRATGCILESIIHSTRVSLYRKLNKPELLAKIDELIFLLKNYRRIIKKVYPNSKYEWIIDDIFKNLGI